jgi:NarL family two-component system sensor histidine kinase YdfH
LEALKAYQQQNNQVKAENVLTQALDRARNTLSESRAAIEDLRNDDRDFQTTLEKLVAEFSATGQTTCELNIELEDTQTISRHIKHHARRVLHEALTNIQKHAQAKNASVSIVQSGNTLELCIQDDGIGFNPDKIPQSGHFGLQGLQERAQLTNSRYILSSSPDEGTAIEFIFSLDEGVRA